MENSLYIALSRQVVLNSQMDMVANNVANVSTPGYRAQNLLFNDYIADPKGQGPAYAMVYDYGYYTSTTPGSMQSTGAPLDIGLNGPGFFEISTPQGPRYTRGGSFTLSADGDIVMPNGYKLSSGGGSGISVPDGSTEIRVDEKGNVSNENGVIGKISVVEFGNTDRLVREGSGLFRAPDNATPTPAENTKTMQGLLEGSNVQPVVETTRMINILRDYQALQRMVQSEHDLERNAIQKLSGQS